MYQTFLHFRCRKCFKRSRFYELFGGNVKNLVDAWFAEWYRTRLLTSTLEFTPWLWQLDPSITSIHFFMLLSFKCVIELLNCTENWKENEIFVEVGQNNIIIRWSSEGTRQKLSYAFKNGNKYFLMTKTQQLTTRF